MKGLLSLLESHKSAVNESKGTAYSLLSQIFGVDGECENGCGVDENDQKVANLNPLDKITDPEKSKVPVVERKKVTKKTSVGKKKTVGKTRILRLRNRVVKNKPLKHPKKPVVIERRESLRVKLLNKGVEQEYERENVSTISEGLAKLTEKETEREEEKKSATVPCNAENGKDKGKEKKVGAVKKKEKKEKKPFDPLDFSNDFCSVCEKEGKLIMCEGVCLRAFHRECLPPDAYNPRKQFVCEECATNTHKCFVCHTGSDECRKVFKCSVKTCGKFYHLECVSGFHLSKYVTNDKFVCPAHFCSSCSEPANVGKGYKAVIRCIRCPVAYHYNGDCCPPGVKVVLENNNDFMLCGKHVHDMEEKRRKHWDYCLYCGNGGSLLCCDGCPAAVHKQCVTEIPFPPSDDHDENKAWYCQYCMNGKRPLSGDVVWVKYANSKWWPSIIMDDDEVQASALKAKRHEVTAVPVFFFGERTCGWIEYGNVLSFEVPYNEKEAKKGPTKFLNAYLEAELAFKKERESKEQKEQKKIAQCKAPKYNKIKTNVYTAKKLLIKETNFPCGCKDKTLACGDANCLNRATLIECDDSICSMKDLCENRRFSNQQYVQTEVCDAGERGWGLKTCQDIKEGDFVVEYVGEMISRAEAIARIAADQRNGLNSFYTITIDDRMAVDARRKGNIARFINHSCSPNCETQKWTVNGLPCVGIFAKQNIPAGTELSFDYQWEDVSGKMAKECRCGSANCSGIMGLRPKKTEEKIPDKKKKKKRRKQRNKLVSKSKETPQAAIPPPCKRKKIDKEFACSDTSRHTDCKLRTASDISTEDASSIRRTPSHTQTNPIEQPPNHFSGCRTFPVNTLSTEEGYESDRSICL